jgi:hypothetical protein
MLVSFHDENHYNSVRNPEALPSKDYLKRFLAEKEEDSEVSEVAASTIQDDKAGIDPPGLHGNRVESISPDSSIRITMEKLSLIGKPQPKRNDPCPCGSGKVFAKCHHADYRRVKTRLEKVKAKNAPDKGNKVTNDTKKQDIDSATPKSGPFREIKI